MSTIIKALRKVENQQQALSAVQPIASTYHPKTVRNKHRKIGFGATRKWVLAGMALLLLAVSGTVFGLWWPQRSREASSPTAEVTPAVTNKLAPKKVSAPQPQVPGTATGKDKLVRRTPASGRTPPPATRAQPPARTTAMPVNTMAPAPRRGAVLPPADQNAPKSARPQSPARPTPVVSAPVRPRTATQTAASRPSVSAATGPEKADLVQPLPRESVSFSLQAIAYSSDPAKRLAVINGRVMHEGGTVEAYTIDSIDENAIILKRDGKHYRLVFGLQ